ncbi:MAG: bifunctional folylpolyglutamate synthase/dihydrofolate synthase [Clostridiales bacterium]|nr:bifunctional folylpolyglutamate synthase/dihydrofolate synthase [Clostridiales bacterium]
MDYNQALEYIHGTYKLGSKLGLENIKNLLNLLGNPHRELKVIHVAGTNGKGSTSSFIYNVLKTAGYKVGLYTSPYIEEYTERIQINGEKIEPQRLAGITSIVKEKIDIMISKNMEHPTEFEVGTAIAMVYFFEEKTDFVVLEVGMGGRLDATNVIENPLLSVITSIGYDHMAELGDSLEKIAFEKSGIIKNDNYVVSYPQEDEAMSIIEKVAQERNNQLFISNTDKLEIKNTTLEEQTFSVEILGQEYEDMKIKLAGKHQIYNACTALTALEVLRQFRNIEIDKDDVYEGMFTTNWMGRLEILNKNPLTIIDGAHNLQGAIALKESIETYLNGHKITLIVGMLRDKDIKGLLRNIIPLVDKVIVTKVNNPRTMAVDDLAKELVSFGKKIYVVKDIDGAINKAYEITESTDAILITGSLYMIGEARTIITKK